MPMITHAMLYIAYALLSATVGLALSRVGGEAPGPSFLGAIALFSACAVTHAGIAASAAARRVSTVEKGLRGDMSRLEAAHRDVRADIESFATRLDSMEGELRLEMTRPPSVAPTSDQPLHLIDQIVNKLERAIDSRVQHLERLAGPARVDANAKFGPIQLVREALIENRVELHLQPIVQLPQRRTVFYEGFTRLKDANGRLILPPEFIPIAEEAGLMPTIDNILTFRCVQIVRKLMKRDRRVGIFCNLSPSALSDEHFFPQFLDFVRENSDLAGALIFEIPQKTFENRTSVEARAMARLADLGFRFSVDKVTTIEIDLPDLERAGVRYIKIGAMLLRDQLVREGRRPKSAITREIAAADVAAVFARYGVELIAERIENEELVLEALDLEAPYGQGHLFGAPRAIKESLMEETAPPREFILKNGRVA